MSTYDLYTTPVDKGTWDIPSTGAARFSWEYDDGRQRLLDLYQRGKDKQWDAAKRIDWDLPVDPCNVMETPGRDLPDLRLAAVGDAVPARTRRARPAPRILAVQPVPARRAGRAHGGRADRGVGARHGLEVLRRHPGHGRGPARRAVPAVHPRQDRPVLPDQRGPGPAARRRAERLPLGHAVPGHAGADRGAGAGGVRGPPRHHRQPPGQAGPGVRDAGRGAARRVRPAGAAGLLRVADGGRAAPTARSSWSRAAT